MWFALVLVWQMYVGILMESFSLDMCFSTSNGNLSLSADEKSSLSFYNAGFFLVVYLRALKDSLYGLH